MAPGSELKQDRPGTLPADFGEWDHGELPETLPADFDGFDVVAESAPARRHTHREEPAAQDLTATREAAAVLPRAPQTGNTEALSTVDEPPRLFSAIGERRRWWWR